MTASVSALFHPFAYGSLKLNNRLVMAPMTRSFSPGGIPGPDVAAYYRRRAEGGIGLIITEGTLINHKAASGYPRCPVLYGSEALAGWKRVVEEVHAAGGRIIPQIWHVGMARQPGMEPDPTVPGYGPSALTMGNEVPAVAMSQADIDEVVAAYAEAAYNAKQAGFDGVEVHGAHGYLIDQFFWAATNQRSDGYGGSFEKRLRFGIEVIEAVRTAVGPEFPVVLRFSQWKPTDYEAKLASTPQQLEQFLTPLSAAGVDIFHASTRRFWQPEFSGSDLNLAGWTKKITGKPSITVGCVGLDDVSWDAAGRSELDELIRRLEREEFDLVAVGRALLADPQWANKVREGRSDEITPYTKTVLQALL